MRNLLDPIKNPTMILSTLLSVPTVSFEVRVCVRSVHGVVMHSPRSPEAVTVAFEAEVQARYASKQLAKAKK